MGEVGMDLRIQDGCNRVLSGLMAMMNGMGEVGRSYKVEEKRARHAHKAKKKLSSELEMLEYMQWGDVKKGEEQRNSEELKRQRQEARRKKIQDYHHSKKGPRRGNTLNCNHPIVMELILDSLRHWVLDYHVDGFRFDLASVLCRGTDGSPLNAPPLIRAIAKDTILSRCKIIAEPWDCGGLYLVGRFPNWDRWAEWNGMYRDDVRRFIKGDYDMKGRFATRIAGSADLYQVNKRKPYHSINFVIAHDGFTLYDLVAYNKKHNDANGEGGNDGCNDNFSWNCGFEGETSDMNVKALRSRQMKNYHLALMISQGTPMMLMGDEYGHTRHGNNNSYGHDTALNHFQWGQLESKKDGHFRFFSEMIKFRQGHHVFRRENFLGKNDVTWHEDNWDNYESKFLAFTLHDETGGDVYVAFNAHDYFVKAVLPSAPQGRQWYRVVDTSLDSPDDIVTEGVPGIKEMYNIAPYCSILFKAEL